MPKRSLPKNTPARRKRGSTGLSKTDRIKKKDALVDYYAARKHLSDLREVSSSSSSDAEDSEISSEDEGENDLKKLQQMLGCDAAEITRANKIASLTQSTTGSTTNNTSSNKKNTTTFLPPQVVAAAVEDTLEDVMFEGKNSKNDDDDDDDEEDVDGEEDEEYELVEEEQEMEDFLDDEGFGADDEYNIDDEDDFDLNDYEIEEQSQDGAAAANKNNNAAASAAASSSSSKGGRYLKDAEEQEEGIDSSERKKNLFAQNELIASDMNPEDMFWRKYIENICGKPDQSELQPLSTSSSSTTTSTNNNNNNNNNKAVNEVVSIIGKGMNYGQNIYNKKQQQEYEEENPEQYEEFLHQEVSISMSQAAQQFVNITSATTDNNDNNDLLLIKDKKLNETWNQMLSLKKMNGSSSSSLLQLCTSYADIAIHCRNWQNGESICRTYACHVINHVLKANAVMAANDNLLDNSNNDNNNDIMSSSSHQLRDRGFGRTRVLVLFPMRNSAFRFMRHICELLNLDFETQFSRQSSFISDFSEMEEVKDPTFRRRPYDFKMQFDGNINDTFCFGVSLSSSKKHNKNNHVKVYMPFLESDIVVASPLGLRKRLEKDGNLSVCLSSIEVVIVDEAQVMLMQNWSHVDAIFDLLNRRPTATTEGLNDVTRIYNWALQGQSRRHRQTILLSTFSHAALSRTLREHCCNSSGKILVTRKYGSSTTEASTTSAAANVVGGGSISVTPGGVRQHFLRLRAETLEGVDDLRFGYFVNTWFPTKIQPLMDQNVRVILYIPNYFDFARVRAWLHEQHRTSFAVICEHSTQKEQRQALGQFSDQERCLLIMTERFYFFRRYFVRDAEAIFFYSPPLIDFFYSDVVSKLNLSSPHAQAHTLFCRYDVHELTRVVGSDRVKQMLSRTADSYLLVNEM